jgi:hypothetical protein
MNLTLDDLDGDLVARIKAVTIAVRDLDATLADLDARRRAAAAERRERAKERDRLLGEFASPTPLPLFDGGTDPCRSSVPTLSPASVSASPSTAGPSTAVDAADSVTAPAPSAAATAATPATTSPTRRPAPRATATDTSQSTDDADPRVRAELKAAGIAANGTRTRKAPRRSRK